MAFPVGWSKEHKITIDYTKVSGASQSNIPILLTEANFLSEIFTNTLSTGADLRFTTDQAGTTEIPFEVVIWDTSGNKAEVWVKIPSLSNTVNTDIYVWYSNGSATMPAVGDADGRNAVWSAYRAVWHSGSVTDSTGNYDLTATGTPSVVDAKIGKGYDLGTANSTKFLTRDSGNILSATDVANITIEQWVKINTNLTVDNAYYCLSAVTTAFATSGAFFNTSYQKPADTHNLEIRSVSHLSTSDAVARYQVDLGTTNYHYFASVKAGTRIDMYLDGNTSVANNTGSGSNNSFTTTTHYVNVGIERATAYGGYGNVIFDEVRVAQSALATTWLGTNYNNQSNPGAFSTASALAGGSSSLKTIMGCAKASIKTINGCAIASVKSFNGLA